MSQLDEEIASLGQRLIAADKALTQEERDQAWQSDKLHMYKDQLRRQLKNLDEDAPDVLLAMNASNQYDVACSLWENDMLAMKVGSERERRRRASGRCVQCARALPLPYVNRQDYCPECDKDMTAEYEEEVCPICGGTEFVEPLTPTAGRRCVKCCDTSQQMPSVDATRQPQKGGE